MTVPPALDAGPSLQQSVAMPGLFNIIIGIVFVIGGATGKMALIGTNSPTALAVVGGGIFLWGVKQLVDSRKGGGKPE